MAPAIDAVNLQGYLETWDERRAKDYPRYIGDVARLVREAAPRAHLWLAEFGYSDWSLSDGRPSQWSYAVDPWEHTAAFEGVALLRAHALALGTSVLSLTTGVEHVFDDARVALEFATLTLGADLDHFVNEGIVQFEYQDSLQNR